MIQMYQCIMFATNVSLLAAEGGYGPAHERPSSRGKTGHLTDLFAQFYGLSHLPTHKECVDSSKLNSEIVKTSDGSYFNLPVYASRIELSAETFLLEAEGRGEVMQKRIFTHVVGLGLGVWMWQPVMDVQTRVFLQAFQRVIKRNKFKWVTVVDFRYV